MKSFHKQIAAGLFLLVASSYGIFYTLHFHPNDWWAVPTVIWCFLCFVVGCVAIFDPA
jgi:hypothetical protein